MSKEETEFTDLGKPKESPLKAGHNPAKDGPKQNRSCTDIICCLLFIIFVGGLVVVGYFAFLYGDPKLLLYPQDSNGNLCGQGDFTDRPNLFFFDLVKCGRMGPGVFVNGCPTPQKCVKECPSTNYVYFEDAALQAATGGINVLPASTKDLLMEKLICIDSVDLATTTKSIIELVADDECAAYYLESTPTINRCVPSFIADLAKSVVELDVNGTTTNLVDGANNTVSQEAMDTADKAFKLFLEAKEYGEKIIADVVTSWWMILIGLFIAMVISLLWITLMRWMAGFMVWLTILIFVVLWAGLTAICWYMYFEEKGQDREMTFYLMMKFTFKKEDLFLAGGIIFGIIFTIVFLILIFLCHRIRIAVALIKQSSRAVGSMWSTLVWPLIPFIMQIAVIAIWGVIAVYLASVGREPNPAANNVTFANGTIDEEKVKAIGEGLFGDVNAALCDGNNQSELNTDACEAFIKFTDGDYTFWLQLYNLFMLFWLVNFVSALGDLTLAGAFSSYYWAFNKPADIPATPLLGGFWRCFRYHLGSLAFGSLLIAIVQVIRVLLEYLDSKLKASENPVAKFLMKCLKCCFWCLEKFIRFLCKNAYIMIAVYGGNFCMSAKRAFELIIANAVRVMVIDKVTDFLLFICKLVVVGGTGVCAYFFFNGDIDYLSDYNPKLNFYMVPIIIVILGSYLIAHIFFSVYETAVDTLFLCFLDDIERNNGTPEKPYFMGKELMELLGKDNLKSQ